jgi:hypothetical protein
MPGYGLAINADRVGNLSLRQALVPQVFDLIGLIHAQMIGHQLIASVSHCKTKDNNPTNPLTRWRTFKRPSLVPFQRPSTLHQLGEIVTLNRNTVSRAISILMAFSAKADVAAEKNHSLEFQNFDKG